jgi:hypothetical protein
MATARFSCDWSGKPQLSAIYNLGKHERNLSKKWEDSSLQRISRSFSLTSLDW